MALTDNLNKEEVKLANRVFKRRGSQIDCANKTGLDRTTIYRVRNNKWSGELPTIEKIRTYINQSA